MSSEDNRIYFNGVNAQTGGYLTLPVAPEEIVARARAEFKQTSQSEREFTRTLNDKKTQPHLGFDANLQDLKQARWGVVFAADEDPAVKRALAPLIEHRAQQLGFTPKVFTVKPDDRAVDFLSNNDVSSGEGEVKKVPYYLLLVGQPTKISFRLQFELDAEYAVGRIAFDSADGYRAYVERLLDYETANAVPTRKQAVFWATANEDDRATLLSSRVLAKPLHDGLDAELGFNKQLFIGDKATKTNLVSQFTQAQPPALVFTTSHGLGFSQQDPQQYELQGALVTQEWLPDTPITSKQIFSARDVSSAANVHGLVHFAFACFGAGTPTHDDYAHGEGIVAPIIADKPFVANLPCQLLARGALAFIGHVERAHGYSFIRPNDQPKMVGFTRALSYLLRGVPIGHALRDLHDHGVQLSHQLIEALTQIDYGRVYEPKEIAEQWRERNDARAHILIGDPGARLRVADMTT
ncbi:MAG: hypothetical protein ABI874_03015 [Chloroflexota bacterium]